MNYNVRIDDNFLKADYVDGEVLQHSDLNELENVVKTAINANYEDIQKIQDGTINSGNAEKLSGATLSNLVTEQLQNSDVKVPTSAQVKNYVDTEISSIDLSGYATKVYTDELVDETVAIYDSTGNGIVDNAEKVNNHTVDKDVPSDAKFTDTLYDDTEVRGLISDLDEDKVDKVSGKGLSTNDYTTTEKTKLSNIANGAQVNVIEKIKVNGVQQSVSGKAVDIPVPTQLSQLSDDSSHRTVTDSEKTTWNNKYLKPNSGIPKTDLSSSVQTSLGKADSALQEHQDISGKEDKSNKVTSISESSTDIEYPSAKCVYDSQEEQNEMMSGLEVEIQDTQEENEYLNSVINQLPKVSGEGTNVTLFNTIKARMNIDLSPSELSQDGTPTPSSPQDVHTISGSNTIKVGNKNVVTNVEYRSQTSRYYPLVLATYSVVNGNYYAISFDTPNTGIECYINYMSETLLTKIGSYPSFTCDGTRKTFIAQGIATGSVSNTGIVSRSTETSETATGLVSNFMIEPIPSASATSTSYEPHQEKEAPLNLPIDNLLNQAAVQDGYVNGDGAINTGHTKEEGYSEFIKVSPNTKYTFQIFESSWVDFGSQNWIGVGEYSTNNVSGFIRRDANYTVTENSLSFTTTSNTQYIVVSARGLASATKAQFSEGTYNSYTPYGTPPIEYCKIGDYEDEFIRTSGKNLFNFKDRTIVSATSSGYDIKDTTKIYNAMTRADGKGNSNITITTLDNGYTLSTANGYYGLGFPFKLKPNTQYTISANISDNTKFSFGIGYYDNTGTYLSNVSSYQESSYTFTTPSNAYISNIVLTLTTANTPVTITNIMLIEGTSTEYEPYGTNEWYIKKNIGKVVLDGSETWTLNSSASDYTEFSGFVLEPASPSSYNYPKSNYFAGDTNNRVISYGSRLLIRVPSSANITTVEDFKTWLSTHNTIVYYILATPTYTKISGTLANQLENIYQKLLSYKGTTNISQVNYDLAFNLSASALEDLNKILSEITNAIIELGGE